MGYVQTKEQVELAEQVMDIIEREAVWCDNPPVRWEQESWLVSEALRYMSEGEELPTADRQGPAANICGTAACFAGWTVATAGLVAAESSEHYGSPYAYELNGRKLGKIVGPVELVARNLLGLEHGEDLDSEDEGYEETASALFYGNNDLGTLQTLVKKMRADYEAREAVDVPLPL